MDQERKTLQNTLTQAGISNAGLEARLLLEEYALGSDALAEALGRRLTGEPLSRILGHQEFWGLRFDLSPDTLDPRQDTETLVELAIALGRRSLPKRILDIGTGSGCVIISILHELGGGVSGVATDLSAGALHMARRNAARHGLENRINFVETAWARGIEGPFDLIVSNPPYIRSDVIPNLDQNVSKFDPILALDGGTDGLDAYRFILTETKKLLSPHGVMLLEIGYDQGDSVQRLVGESGATRNVIHPDLAGNPRVAEISYGDN